MVVNLLLLNKGIIMIKEQNDRKIEVVEWLESSDLAKAFHKSTEGFHVFSGQCVRFENGKKLDVLDWLSREGIEGGVCIGGYNVSYTPRGEYDEKMTFFRIESIGVPFAFPEDEGHTQSVKSDVAAESHLNDAIPF